MTNTNDTLNTTTPDDGHLSPELRNVASMLNRLAARDAGRAGGSLADRIFVKTRSSVVHEGMTPEVRKVNDALRRSGTYEVGSIPADLETRVFVATVGAISTHEPAVAGRIGPSRWIGRLALAAGLLLAAGGVVWLLSQPVAPTSIDGTETFVTNANNAAGGMPDEIEAILATSEAEESFAALFTLSEPGEDDASAFGTEVASLMKEAARVEAGLSLPTLGTEASGG
jgi:hypothetical protein